MSRMAEQQLYINGGYTSATSGRTFETINPATGSAGDRSGCRTRGCRPRRRARSVGKKSGRR